MTETMRTMMMRMTIMTTRTRTTSKVMMKMKTRR
jgi:hypothetical protein